MKFSKRIDYGLILLSRLAAEHKRGEFVALRGVASEFGVPYHFLEKIAAQLKAAGIITSRQGSEGGYALARSPAKIDLEEVMSVLEKPRLMRCLESGAARCLIAAKCPTRRRWEVLDKKIAKVLRATTLAEI